MLFSERPPIYALPTAQHLFYYLFYYYFLLTCSAVIAHTTAQSHATKTETVIKTSNMHTEQELYLHSRQTHPTLSAWQFQRFYCQSKLHPLASQPPQTCSPFPYLYPFLYPEHKSKPFNKWTQTILKLSVDLQAQEVFIVALLLSIIIIII